MTKRTHCLQPVCHSSVWKFWQKFYLLVLVQLLIETKTRRIIWRSFVGFKYIFEMRSKSLIIMSDFGPEPGVRLRRFLSLSLQASISVNAMLVRSAMLGME